MQNKRTGEQAMANIKGRISYDKEAHTVKSDFWKNGVAGSRRILKKVLKKINIYEEQHTKLEEQVNKKLGKRYRRLGKGKFWSLNLHNIFVAFRRGIFGRPDLLLFSA